MISLRRIFSSSALRGIDVVVQIFCTLWITPRLVHALGVERYGVWVTVLTLVSYLDIFDLGLTSAVTRYVSRALGRDDRAAASETVRAAFSVLLGIGLACLVLVGALVAGVPLLLHETAQVGPVRGVIAILGVVTALSFPLRVFAGVLEAFVRYECTTSASIIRTVLTTAALWWALGEGGDLILIVSVVAAGGLFQRALNFAFARGVFPEMRLLPLGANTAARGELLGYGGKNFAMKLVDVIRFRIDNLVIARGVGLAPVGVYSIGMSLIRYYRELIDCLGSVLMPVFSRAEGAGQRDDLRAKLSAMTRLCACIAMLIGGGIVLYGDLFIEWWLGPRFDHHASYIVALILAGPFIVAMAQNPGIYLLYGLSKQERLLRLNVIEAIGNFVLSVGLVFKFGIYGVAAGTAISLLITKVALQPAIVCEESGVSLRVYYFSLLLLPLTVTAAAMIACHAALLTWLRPELWRLIGAGAAQTLVVGAVAWIFLAGDRFRGSVLRAFVRKAA